LIQKQRTIDIHIQVQIQIKVLWQYQEWKL